MKRLHCFLLMAGGLGYGAQEPERQEPEHQKAERQRPERRLLAAHGLTYEFVRIPPGTFLMGSVLGKRTPLRRIRIQHPFFLGTKPAPG